MTARQHMAQIVEATGLYQLTGSTPADWELSRRGRWLCPDRSPV